MKTVLITGTSSGIGRATAKLFSKNGYQVVATMRCPEKETELHDLKNVFVTKLDVEKNADAEVAMKKGIDKFGKIDILINNAGYCAFGPLEMASEEQIKRQYEVNVFGVMRTIQAILPHFRSSGGGMIVNISSIGGKIANPFLSLYQSSKFAIEGLTESLYYELSPHNIRVKLIEPGNIDTDFTGRSLEVLQNAQIAQYNEYVQKFLDVLTLDREQGNISSAETVAKVLLKAVTDQTDQVRYLVGKDAELLEERRKQMSDTDFLRSMKQGIGL